MIVSLPAEYVVIDIETTGLSPIYDEIIEIAAIRVSDSKVVDEFEVLINSIAEIPNYISDFTGITNLMLKNAAPIEKEIVKFKSFIKNTILVGQNIRFDIDFLNANLKMIDECEIKNDYIDVMELAREKLFFLDHHRQSDLANYYGIPNHNPHRAMNDCIVCNKVLISLVNDK